MKKNRCFKLTALLLALVMLLSTMPAFANDANDVPLTVSDTVGQFTVIVKRELDAQFVSEETAIFEGENKVELSEKSDPNKEYILKLKVSEPMYEDTTDANKGLPEKTDKVRMSYKIPENVVATDGANSDVSWSFDAAAGDVVFQWVDGKKSSFSADIVVSVKYPGESLGLNGNEYVMTNKGVTGIVLPEQRSDNRLKGQKYDNAGRIESGKIWMNNYDLPMWKFTHVSGNWYTIDHNGSYIHIDGEAVTLSSDPQALYIEKTNEGYLIQYNGRYLDAYNGDPNNGFRGYNGASTTKLFSSNQISNVETLGLDGQSYYLGFNSTNEIYRVLVMPNAKDEPNTGYLDVASYIKVSNDTFQSQGLYAAWTFTKDRRNWYVISNGGKYLNISSDGASLSDTPQSLLVMEKNGLYQISNGLPYTDGTVFLDCKELNTNGYKDGGAIAGIEKNGKDDYVFILFTNVSETQNTNLAGTWYILNPETGKAMSDEQLSGGMLKSVGYKINNSKAESTEEGTKLTAWTFKNGSKANWYTVQNPDGLYLKIDGRNVTLQSGRTEVFVQLKNGKYRICGGDAYALNIDYFAGNNAVFGYGDWSSHEQMQLVEAPTEPEGEELYNLAQVNGGTWYRLKKTTFRPNVTLAEKLKGLSATGNSRSLTDGEYTVDDYDFTNLTIRINNKDYIYYCPQNAEAILEGAKYYTAEFMEIVAVKNKIGGMNGNNPNWLIPTEDRYDDKNGTDSFHRNYKITTHDKIDDNSLFENLYLLKFDLNGGIGGETPARISCEGSDIVTLPNVTTTDANGKNFIGWSESNNFYQVNSGEKSTYHILYRAGENFRVRNGVTTLYAVYNTTSYDVRFGVRLDGQIQDEPNVYDTSFYGGHFWMRGHIRNTDTWVIDIDGQKEINGYYLNNNVMAAITEVPSAEQIKKALKAEGNIDFDPETQYIHWYVMKYTGKEWHIDGVIRDKKKVGITYDANVENVTEKIAVLATMPTGYEMAYGARILIGTNKDETTVRKPSRDGYIFIGWNTEKDGSGTAYSGGGYLRMEENVHLYAQWEQENLMVMIDSDWPERKPAYAGTMITLTAVLTGFENKDYELQWEYSLDNKQTWTAIDDSDNSEIITETDGDKMKFIVNATTADLIWRVVAINIRNKE